MKKIIFRFFYVWILMLVFLLSCAKENNVIIYQDQQKRINEEFEAANPLGDYQGDFYRIDSSHSKPTHYVPWIYKDPDSILTDITIYDQDTVLFSSSSLLWGKVRGLDDIIFFFGEAHCEHAAIFHQGKFFSSPDFITHYVKEVRLKDNYIYMKWKDARTIWMRYDLTEKVWLYQTETETE